MTKRRPRERMNEQNLPRAAAADSANDAATTAGAELVATAPATTARALARSAARLTAQHAAPWTPLEWAAFAGLCLLLAYPPYFRGLFFPKEQLVTLIITLVVFMLWWVARWRRGETVLLQHPLDYAALALVGAYVLSLFVAVNPRAAIQEVVKQLNYFLIYWLVSRMAREPRLVRIGPLRASPLFVVLNVMLLSAVGVAVAGVGVAAGTFRYNGAFDGTRISSTLQYPNSLAAYLTAAFFLALALALALHVQRRWLRLIYAAAAQLLFLPFMLTYSRGAWLAFPVVAVAFLVMLPRGKRLAGMLMLGAVTAPAALGIPIFVKGVAAKHATTVWAGYGASAAAAVLFALMIDWFLVLPGRVRFALSSAAAVAIVTGASLGAVRIASKPLSIGHESATPGSSSRHYTESLWGLEPDAEYTLSFEVSATGSAGKDAWVVSVVGYNSDGQATTLLRRAGKPGDGWASQDAKFRTRFDTERGVVQLVNAQAGSTAQPGTTATFRNVRLVGPDGTIRNLSFFWEKAIPQALLDRLVTITPQDFNAMGRIYFARDAWKIISDFALLGTGGGGWASVYFKYQSYGYFTTQVHNHLLQTWVEVGTVGLLALLALWATLAYTWWRASVATSERSDYTTHGTHNGNFANNVRAGHNAGNAHAAAKHHIVHATESTCISASAGANHKSISATAGDQRSAPTGSAATAPAVSARVLLAGLGATALALNGHSLIDFNLSLSAVSFYLWAAMGATAPAQATAGPTSAVLSARLGTHRRRTTSLPARGVACLLAVVAIAAGAVALLAGANYGVRGARALTSGNVAQAKALFASAIKWDPWTASFHLDLAQAEEIVARNARDGNPNRKKLLDEADVHMKRGLQLDGYNPQYRSIHGGFLLRAGRLDEGVATLEQALELQPFQIRNYENLANAYFAVARHLLEHGSGHEDHQKALDYLARLTALPQRITAQKAKEPANVRTYVTIPEKTPQLALSVGKGLALMQRYEEAQSSLETAANDRSTQAEALLWLAVVAERQGDMLKKKELLSKALKLDPALQVEQQAVLRLLQRL